MKNLMSELRIRSSSLFGFWFLLTLTFSYAACGQNSSGYSPIFEVPFVKLIVDPAPYIDKNVGVVGYAGLGFNLVLFHMKSHSDFGDITSGVVLQDVPTEAHSCSGQYVRVVGYLSVDRSDTLQLKVMAIYTFDEANAITELCWSRPNESIE